MVNVARRWSTQLAILLAWGVRNVFKWFNWLFSSLVADNDWLDEIIGRVRVAWPSSSQILLWLILQGLLILGCEHELSVRVNFVVFASRLMLLLLGLLQVFSAVLGGGLLQSVEIASRCLQLGSISSPCRCLRNHLGLLVFEKINICQLRVQPIQLIWIACLCVI